MGLLLLQWEGWAGAGKAPFLFFFLLVVGLVGLVGLCKVGVLGGYDCAHLRHVVIVGLGLWVTADRR